MGSLNSFECENCNYSAEVSGGEDAGFEVAVQTMICDGCGELVDAVIGKRKDPSKDFDPVPERCPNCRGDGVKPWDESHPCPKCGCGMRDGGLTVLWD